MEEYRGWDLKKKEEVGRVFISKFWWDFTEGGGGLCTGVGTAVALVVVVVVLPLKKEVYIRNTGVVGREFIVILHY